MTTTTTTLHFSVEGRFITDLARARVLEGAPDSAYNILGSILADAKGEPLPGLIAEVLAGNKALSGVNTMKLVKEKPAIRKKWIQDALSVFGRRWRVDGKWYAPFGIFRQTPKFVARAGYSADGRRARDVGHANGLIYQLFSTYIRNPLVKWHPLPGHEIEPTRSACVRGEWIVWEPVEPPPTFLLDIMQHRQPDVADMVLDIYAYDDQNKHGASIWSPVLDEPPFMAEPTKEELEKQAAERKRREAEQDKRHEEEHRKHLMLLLTTASKIRMYAEDHGGFFNLDVPGYGRLEIPALAFEWFCYFRKRFYAHEDAEALPPKQDYTAFSEQGWKMGGDDPYHTDWVLGSRLYPTDGSKPEPITLDYRSDDPVVQARIKAIDDATSKAIWAYQEAVRQGRMPTVQEMQTGELRQSFPAVILADGDTRGTLSGTAVHAKANEPVPEGSIAILEDGGPDFEAAVASAVASITPVGGMLCHLAVISRGTGNVIVRVQDARDVIPEGAHVQINLDTGTVEVQ